MKTASKSTLAKKLSTATVSKSSKAYQVVVELIGVSDKKSFMLNGNIIRPVYTSGKGRFCSNQDHTMAIKSLLTFLGIEFIFSNDSVRGGLTGNKIEITTKIK